MAELKTQKTDASVAEFLKSIPDETRRKDCEAVAKMMQKATGAKPRMWGASIVGFGNYHYKYASGREGDWFLAGFSPRKANLTLYIMAGFREYDDLMARLGKHKTGKSCLYVNTLKDIDMGILEELVKRSVAYMRTTYE